MVLSKSFLGKITKSHPAEPSILYWMTGKELFAIASKSQYLLKKLLLKKMCLKPVILRLRPTS